MVRNPSTATYMPYQPPIIGTSYYGNAPGYSPNQAPFAHATKTYQQGVPTNGHAFQPQMAQGTPNPNYVHRQDMPR